jgi:integrase
MALVRAAETDRDGVLYLTAAFTGLRLGELLALVWEDVDFESDALRVQRNWTAGQEGTPKSGRGRAVPMMEEVARALAELGQRERFTGAQDLEVLEPRRARGDLARGRPRALCPRDRAGAGPLTHDDRA